MKKIVKSTELPALLFKAVTAYHQILLKRYGSMMFMDACPAYFNRTRETYEVSTDPTFDFFYGPAEDRAESKKNDKGQRVSYTFEFREDARTDWIELQRVHKLWVSNITKQGQRKPESLTDKLGIWDNLKCKFSDARITVIKPCPDEDLLHDRLCKHINKKQAHKQWKRIFVLGIEMRAFLLDPEKDLEWMEEE